MKILIRNFGRNNKPTFHRWVNSEKTDEEKKYPWEPLVEKIKPDLIFAFGTSETDWEVLEESVKRVGYFVEDEKEKTEDGFKRILFKRVFDIPGLPKEYERVFVETFSYMLNKISEFEKSLQSQGSKRVKIEFHLDLTGGLRQITTVVLTVVESLVNVLEVFIPNCEVETFHYYTYQEDVKRTLRKPNKSDKSKKVLEDEEISIACFFKKLRDSFKILGKATLNIWRGVRKKKLEADEVGNYEEWGDESFGVSAPSKEKEENQTFTSVIFTIESLQDFLDFTHQVLILRRHWLFTFKRATLKKMFRDERIAKKFDNAVRELERLLVGASVGDEVENLEKISFYLAECLEEVGNAAPPLALLKLRILKKMVDSILNEVEDRKKIRGEILLYRNDIKGIEKFAQKLYFIEKLYLSGRAAIALVKFTAALEILLKENGCYNEKAENNKYWNYPKVYRLIERIGLDKNLYHSLRNARNSLAHDDENPAKVVNLNMIFELLDEAITKLKKVFY